MPSYVYHEYITAYQNTKHKRRARAAAQWKAAFCLNLMNNQDLTLSELSQYSGTEKYTNVLGHNVTDGVVYVMQNGYSWIVTDFLSLVMPNCPIKDLKDQSFLTVQLKIYPDKKGEMIITDGNEKVLYTQKYEYTDAKKEFLMYYIDGVLLLSGEY